MKKHTLAFFAFPLLVIASVAASAESDGEPITSVAKLAAAASAESMAEERFNLEATLTSDITPQAISFTIQDGRDFALIVDWRKQKELLVAGDRVRIDGHIRTLPKIGRHAIVGRVKLLAHGEVLPPFDVSAADIYSGRFTGARVRVRGLVADAFRDEIDPNYTFLALSTASGTLYLPSTSLSDATIASLVGAEIEAVGTCVSYDNHGPRAKLGYEVTIGRATDIRVLTPAPTDPFDVPELGGTVYEVFKLHSQGVARRKVRGQVLAVWQHSRVIVRTPRGETSIVALAADRLPQCGAFIEAVGFPETDFYNLNLSRAIWRATAPLKVAELIPEPIVVDRLMMDEQGRRKFNVGYHGLPVRFSGSVQNSASGVNGNGVFQLLSGESVVPVDASAVPEIWSKFEVGAKVEVTGVCLVATENWRPQVPFPHVSGLSIVLRTADDLKVLARPPWWTPVRLGAVIGSLLFALLVIIVWNIILRRLIERKGRQLFKAQIAKAESELRIDERTHLAVELHDLISQNLTGVALEVNAANRLADRDQSLARQHLTRASQTLKSCREELRNCLWDLRSNALGETTMDEAIRKTLAPQVGETELHVRFAVARRKLTDKTAHTILRIIRELAVNAIRHGAATKLYIAGSEELGSIYFSVRDNGNGFELKSAPGIQEGHFGLQGIRERVKEYHGEFELESVLGKGVKAVIRLGGINEKA